MSTFDNQYPEIRNVMNHTPMGEAASDELKRKLRLLATQTPARRVSPWPSRLMVAGAAAAGIGVVALTMMPSKASAYERMMNAAAHENTFRFSITSSELGANKHVEIAGSDGNFIVKTDDGGVVHLSSQGKMEIYDPGNNTVLVLSTGGMIDGKQLAGQIEKGLSEGLKEMDVQKMLKDYEQKFGKENIHVGPITHRFGESTYQIDLANPKESSQVHITVNADNDLPKQIQMDKRQEDGSWSPNTRIEMSFGDPGVVVSAPQFPANAKRVEMDFQKIIDEGSKNFEHYKNK
jgi:hypothetical protein